MSSQLPFQKIQIWVVNKINGDEGMREILNVALHAVNSTIAE
jgi:hypothetical protein